MKIGIEVVLLCLLALFAPAASADEVAPTAEAAPAAANEEPRVLVVALDGVPYRLLRQAKENGAFEGWPEARPLVSTFPSMTNVAFTAMLFPLGAERVRGYEIRHYDPDKNRVHGGGFASKKKTFAWKSLFDVISKGNYAKARVYMTPRSMARAELDKVAKAVLESPKEFMLAHVASTDMLMHFVGDSAALEALEQAAESIDELRRQHLEIRGRPLRVILLSDHGNTFGKVEIVVDGLSEALQKAGLRVSKKLKRPEDVLFAAYGIVGYAALFSDPENAEVIATSLLEVEGVAFTAWNSGESEISILAAEGLARIRWRSTPEGRELQYDRQHGDPFGLLGTLTEMQAAGLVDDEGYASREDWFTHTASADYPDGLARLTDALSGTWVTVPATVMVGLQPGYACGGRSVRVGAWFKGGHLEGTHGGLDRDSSWGFFLDSELDRVYPPVMRGDRALVEFVGRVERESADGDSP